MNFTMGEELDKNADQGGVYNGRDQAKRVNDVAPALLIEGKQ